MLDNLNAIVLASKKYPAISVNKNKDNFSLLGSKKNTTLDWIIQCLRSYDVINILVVIGENNKSKEIKN